MPLGSKKEIHLELALEVLNLLAQRRLGGVQPTRRMSEMELFRDRDKVSKVAKLHGRLSFIPSTSQPERNKRLEAFCRMSYALCGNFRRNATTWHPRRQEWEKRVALAGWRLRSL